LWVCDGIAADYIRTECGFPSAHQVGYLRKRTYLLGVLENEEHHYGVTSYKAYEFSAKDFLNSTREHWEVENGLHHVKDRSWSEDHQYSNNRARGSILGVLRNLSLNAMRVLSPPDADRQKRKYQKSLPLQAISYIMNPIRALAKLMGI
jgi:hypothetical protein